MRRWWRGTPSPNEIGGPDSSLMGVSEFLEPLGPEENMGHSDAVEADRAPSSDIDVSKIDDSSGSSGVVEAKNSEPHHGLRRLSMQGGAYLMGRESSGIAIRLVGVLFLTRAIGPYNYGLYTAAAAFVSLLAGVAQLGVEVSLISSSEQPSDRAYDTAFTLLLINSVAAVGVGLVGALVVESVSHPPPYMAAFLVLLLSIPLNICWAPAQSRIERHFDYRRMAILELGGDVVLYATSIPLALAGFGVWAPTIGFIAWQGYLFVGSLIVAGVVPRLAWDRDEVRRMLRFGRGYGLATCLMNMTGLVNPLVVGHFVGPAGVGYVAVAQRLAATLAFVNRAVGRLALVALGRVQNDLVRLRRGVEEAMAIQVVALGPLLAGFAVVSSFAIPALIGRKWNSVIDVYPYLALADLLVAVFLIPQAILSAKGKTGALVIKQATGVIVLALVALWLVPKFGVTGFGLAMVAMVAPSAIIHVAARRVVLFRYTRTVPWLVAFCPPLFFALPPWPWRLFLLVPVALVVIVPSMRRDLGEYIETAWSSIRRGRE
jgi:O-antigen/teichoic acid export membrane protein